MWAIKIRIDTHKHTLPSHTQQRFPTSVDAAVVQARASVRAALAAGATLLEVEIPPQSISAVAGDGDGAAEMLAAARTLRSLLREFEGTASTTRVYFPDAKEAEIARGRRGMDPAAGSVGVPATFAGTRFKIDWLTKPSAFSDAGLDLFKRDVGATVAPDDTLLACAYPSFNVNEILAIGDLFRSLAARRAAGTAPPIIIHCGELDRIVSGYYPPLFYPKVAKVGREILDPATNPAFCTAFYVKNFKSGSMPGTLFRAFPGPWCVLAGPLGEAGRKVVYARDERPTLQRVARELLPKAYGRAW